mmetsp:Transcript_125863/g.246693  ORF Transcript_125863/g.246693 Transcript_125863/m.246693 type:complete len:142 (-) Transcript_125863:69-494(-)|eukprot:CAMPEP_0170356350 /NCGR_PEP_ID=MMETSP0117_2-20130122/1125_1 /TAXON_ID=400756 /ORGANISM="Durinskia baltica, Strain CSIRO CS-38" /LENGTH=141 /DNA_ID=CAMNT_0010610441 /DNA_START=126 /DNA_END=551 /DNA_ORIENTATION=+
MSPTAKRRRSEIPEANVVVPSQASEASATPENKQVKDRIDLEAIYTEVKLSNDKDKSESEFTESISTNTVVEGDEAAATSTFKKCDEIVDSVQENDPNDIATFCAPCVPPLSTTQKRKLTDDEIFSRPNRHVYNGYCPCCD